MKLIARAIAISLLVAVSAVAANQTSNTRAFDACMKKGSAFEAKNDLPKAHQYYSKAIELCPKDCRGYSFRGHVLGIAGDNARYAGKFENAVKLYTRAVADLNKAIALDPECVDAYWDRGAAYDLLGMHEAALGDYSKVLQFKPKESKIYFARGNIYGSMEQYSKAIADFSLALKYNPKMRDAYFSRGSAYFCNNEATKAMADFDAAIELSPNWIQAYFAKGMAYEKLGQIDDAIATYRKGLATKPKATPREQAEITAMRLKMQLRMENLEGKQSGESKA